MEYVYKKVEELVKDEITDATGQPGLCHSWYEKYAVTLEKLQKCEKEVQITSEYLNSLWFEIKESITEYSESSIKDIYEHAIKAACEAILVAAMVKKEVDREVGDGTAEISDHGGYSGKDPVRVFFCDACRNDFVSGNRPHPHFCPECGAEFTNVLRF